jgi:hypothetical protein
MHESDLGCSRLRERLFIIGEGLTKETAMEQFKKPPVKKQPEPDSLDQQKQEDPDQIKPQNEEPEKHQTGHQL